MKRALFNMNHFIVCFCLSIFVIVSCDKTEKQDIIIKKNSDSIYYIQQTPSLKLDLFSQVPNWTEEHHYFSKELLNLDVDQDGVNDFRFNAFYSYRINPVSDTSLIQANLSLESISDSSFIIISGNESIKLDETKPISLYLKLIDFIEIQNIHGFVEPLNSEVPFYLGFIVNDSFGWIRLKSDTTNMNIEITDWAVNKTNYGIIYPGQKK